MQLIAKKVDCMKQFCFIMFWRYVTIYKNRSEEYNDYLNDKFKLNHSMVIFNISEFFGCLVVIMIVVFHLNRVLFPGSFCNKATLQEGVMLTIKNLSIYLENDLRLLLADFSFTLNPVTRRF